MNNKHNPSSAEALQKEDPSAHAFRAGAPGYSDHEVDSESVPAWHGADASSAEGAIDPDSGVKRGLKNRHLSMMALAGIIGPGLLVGAGGALNSGGPASLLIGFGVIGEYLSLYSLSLPAGAAIRPPICRALQGSTARHCRPRHLSRPRATSHQK